MTDGWPFGLVVALGAAGVAVGWLASGFLAAPFVVIVLCAAAARLFQCEMKRQHLRGKARDV